jgi:cobalt-zinc-cadmium efflux system outer membrane protein
MDREAMTMASLPLRSLYQRWPRVSRANAELAATDAEAVGQRQQLALSAAHAFHRMALAQIGTNASRDLVAWLDSIVAYNRVRVAEGVAAEADLIRSQLERDRAAAEEALMTVELVRATAELKSFVSDTTNLRIVIDTLPMPIAALARADGAPPIDGRPDVRAARRRAEAAAAGVRVERTLIVDAIDVTIGVKRSAGFSSLIAGASLPVPLFNQNRGEIARASAERDVAVLELAAVERAARADLQAAIESAVVLTERTSVLATGFLARADEARSITLGAYREGAIPLLYVIDAARAWGEARRGYYELLFAQHESVLELFVARGGDLATWNDLENR